MGYYENIKCGNCKHSFTGGYVRSNGFLKTYLGVPYIKCPNCGSVNRTNFKPYSTFHIIEKIYHWFSVIFRSTLFGVIYGVIGAGVVNMLFINSENILNRAGILIVILSVIGMNIYQIRGELKDIKDVEEEYEAMT